MKRTIIFAVVISLTSVALIISQYAVTRDSRYDQQTEQDLNVIDAKISQSLKDQNELPANLEALELDTDLLQRAQERNYQIKSGSSSSAQQPEYYELCADFKTDTRPSDSEEYNYGFPSLHDSGQYCFKRIVEDFLPRRLGV